MRDLDLSFFHACKTPKKLLKKKKKFLHYSQGFFFLNLVSKTMNQFKKHFNIYVKFAFFTVGHSMKGNKEHDVRLK